MTDSSFLYWLGFGLVFAGITILIAATLFVSVLRSKNGKMKTVGVIVVGPVPIVFGSDKKTVKTILKLAVALSVMFVVLSVIYYFLLR